MTKTRIDQFDETDLLALIEDKLEPEQAAAIRRRLAGVPQTLALVERLREDRMLLRTMDEPQVPGDLLAELEPMLARPMLMADSGDWRRRYRQRMPWKRYVAAAAVLIIVVLAGLWATTSGVIGFGRGSDSPRVRHDDAVALPSSATSAERLATLPLDDDQWPPSDAVIHHFLPVPAVGVKTLAAADPSSGHGDRADSARLTATRFVLVINAPDQDDVEQTLRRVLQELEGEAALVRNFSYPEAQQLARQLRLDRDRGVDRDLAEAFDDFAGIAMSGADRLTTDEGLLRRRKAAGRFARTLERSEVAVTVSGLLVGRRSLAPTYEQQLEFAEGGARYTISVPVDHLNDVLARLQLTEGQTTSLQVWRDGGAVGDSGVNRWLNDYPRILRDAALLEGTVMLPVVVDE